MSNYTKCPTLADFFKVKNELESIDGMVYVKSQTNPPKRGVNYVKQQGFLFSTCSEMDYEQFNNGSDES